MDSSGSLCSAARGEDEGGWSGTQHVLEMAAAASTWSSPHHRVPELRAVRAHFSAPSASLPLGVWFNMNCSPLLTRTRSVAHVPSSRHCKACLRSSTARNVRYMCTKTQNSLVAAYELHQQDSNSSYNRVQLVVPARSLRMFCTHTKVEAAPIRVKWLQKIRRGTLFQPKIDALIFALFLDNDLLVPPHNEVCGGCQHSPTFVWTRVCSAHCSCRKTGKSFCVACTLRVLLNRSTSRGSLGTGC